MVWQLAVCNLTAQSDCSGLQAWMLLSQLAQAGQVSKLRRGEAVYPYVFLCPFVLSAAVSIALTGLVGWHAYLVWHAQVSDHLKIQLACNVLLLCLCLLNSAVSTVSGGSTVQLLDCVHHDFTAKSAELLCCCWIVYVTFWLSFVGSPVLPLCWRRVLLTCSTFGETAS